MKVVQHQTIVPIHVFLRLIAGSDRFFGLFKEEFGGFQVLRF
jgi:hypothetical protein